MWICTHCHAENKDGYSSCDQCGATRSAGRFGSAPTVMGTRQQIPVPAPAAGNGQPLHRQLDAQNQQKCQAAQAESDLFVDMESMASLELASDKVRPPFFPLPVGLSPGRL